MNISVQPAGLPDLKPRITVIGVGGAGGNAINNMISSGLTGVRFVAANTDAQALANSSAEEHLQLGVNLTEGLGAGSKPEIGQAAAEEAVDEIRTRIIGSHMVFIAAGMGGGTGTGAAAVIARTAKELGILTVGVVTKPFHFEGARRHRAAEIGIEELRRWVDTLIVIPNQNLFRITNEKTTFAEAFALADQVLYSGIACIVDLIVKEGLINLDFADVRTVMSGMGSAMMGTGEASGENRASVAAEEAIANPLLDDVSLRGAKGLLLSIIGGHSLTLYEVDEAASRIRQEVDPEANIIVGATFDEALGDRIRVSIVASGMPRKDDQRMPRVLSADQGDKRAPREAHGAPPPVPSSNARSPVSHNEMMRALSEAIDTDGPLEPTAPPRWRGPGGVVIEDGMPPSAMAPVARSGHAPPPHAGASFAPAAPTPVRRDHRRMPALEDFPPVGQRDYRAKQGDAAPPPGHPQTRAGRGMDSPVRKPTLFERLTGVRRKTSDSQGETESSYPQVVHQRPAPRLREDDEASGTAASDDPQTESTPSQQRADMPAYLGRDRRR